MKLTQFLNEKKSFDFETMKRRLPRTIMVERDVEKNVKNQDGTTSKIRDRKKEFWRKNPEAYPYPVYKTSTGLVLRIEMRQSYSYEKKPIIEAKFVFYSDNPKLKAEGSSRTINFYINDNGSTEIANNIYEHALEEIKNVSTIKTKTLMKKHYLEFEYAHKGGEYNDYTGDGSQLEYSAWLQCPITGKIVRSLGRIYGEDRLYEIRDKYRKEECKH
jgi:hypothetical protein